MQLYKIIQYGSCAVGLTLFLYGIIALPQPQTHLSTSANPKSSQEIQDAYSYIVIRSPQFIVAMVGAAAFLVGGVWIYLSQPTELPIAPVPAPMAPRPVEVLEPDPQPPRPILRGAHLTILPLGEGAQELV
jgi:hypothetical protein